MKRVLNVAGSLLGIAALVILAAALLLTFGGLGGRPVAQESGTLDTSSGLSQPLPATAPVAPYPPPQTATVVPPATPTSGPYPPPVTPAPTQPAVTRTPTLQVVGTATPRGPRPPTPTPPGYTPVYTGTPPTATPYPGEIRPPPVFTTPTPLPISQTTDLVPDLPDEEKMVNIIRRADGSYEKFLTSIHHTGDVRTLIGLGSEDVLIFHYPLKPRPSTPLVRTTPTSGLFTFPLATSTGVSSTS